MRAGSRGGGGRGGEGGGAGRRAAGAGEGRGDPPPSPATRPRRAPDRGLENKLSARFSLGCGGGRRRRRRAGSLPGSLHSPHSSGSPPFAGAKSQGPRLQTPEDTSRLARRPSPAALLRLTFRPSQFWLVSWGRKDWDKEAQRMAISDSLPQPLLPPPPPRRRNGEQLGLVT